MIDPRITALAEQLIFHSCRLKPGEKVLIESIGYEEPLVKELIRVAYQAGGVPFVTIKEPAVTRQLLLSASQAQLERMAAWECARMSEMDAYIGLRSGCNPSEMSDVPAEQMDRYERLYGKPLHSDIRVPKTKWVVLRLSLIHICAAHVFGVSKSTVHKDMTERLPHMNAALAAEVAQVLAVNKAERHVRGGQATYLKFKGSASHLEA